MGIQAQIQTFNEILTTHATDMSLKLIDLTLIQKNKKNLTNSSSFHQNFRLCGNN